MSNGKHRNSFFLIVFLAHFFFGGAFMATKKNPQIGLSAQGYVAKVSPHTYAHGLVHPEVHPEGPHPEGQRPETSRAADELTRSWCCLWP